MKRLITLLALGTALGLQAAAQESAPSVAVERNSRLTAAQAEQLNKQIAEARKKIDEAQAQLTALQNAAVVAPPARVAPVAPMAPIAPTHPEPPVAPVAPEPLVKSDAISRLGGSYTVGEGEVVEGDARVVGGSLTVDGVVKGVASVAGGTLRINGTVEGDASTTGGSMYLGPDAVVKGNLQCIGGTLHREAGSRVDGAVRWRGNGGFGSVEGVGGMKPDTEEALTDTAFPLPLAIAFLLAGMVFLTVAPKRIDTIGRAFVNQPMYSLLVGIAAIPLSIILFIVSVITVVGPLMVSVGMVGAFLMGVTAVAMMLGRRVALGKTYRSRFFPLVVGLVVWFLASAFSRMVGPLFALMCVVTGVAYMMALGAAIGTGFGKQSGWLKYRMDGNRAGTPWIDPSYTYAGNDKL